MCLKGFTGSATLLLVVFISVFSVPVLTSAQANVDEVADLMCTNWIPGCPPCSKQKPGPNGKCVPDPTNMFMCPCAGPHASGKCLAPGQCKAEATVDGKTPDTGLQQLMQQLSQMMQQLMKGESGGSGSGSDGGNYSPGCLGDKPTSTVDGTTCQNYYGSTGNPNTSNLLNSVGSGSSGLDLLSTQLGGNGSTNTNTNNNSNTTTNTTNSSSGSTGNSSNVVSGNSLIASIQNITPGTNASASQSAFGAAPGVTGDIQVLSGNHVTVLASNRDVSANKQSSGFYGFATSITQSTKDIYVQICASRPWSSNFLSFITPATYFDALCSSHGYAVGPPKLTPATPPPSPTPPPAAQATTTPTPQYLGPMSADIWASPTSVASGARTSIFWSAKGVLSCALSSKDTAFSASSLSGSASTQPLIKNSTFTIACQSATSSVSRQVTVNVN